MRDLVERRFLGLPEIPVVKQIQTLVDFTPFHRMADERAEFVLGRTPDIVWRDIPGGYACHDRGIFDPTPDSSPRARAEGIGESKLSAYFDYIEKLESV